MVRYTTLEKETGEVVEIECFGYHPVGSFICHNGQRYKVIQIEGKVYNGRKH